MFENRSAAGRMLAGRVRDAVGIRAAVVLALPRGGVPVGLEIARLLGAPLDVFLVRKLGVPGHEELAFGAIASGGRGILNREIVAEFRLSDETIAGVTAREEAELERRESAYREGRAPLPVVGANVVVVDDGLATGASMLAAVRALRTRGADQVVVAVPVGPQITCRELASEADEVICLATPARFESVGEWYRDFRQVGDDEVRSMLRAWNAAGPASE